MKPSRIALLASAVLFVWAALFAASRALDRRASAPPAARNGAGAPRPFRRLLYPATVVTRFFGAGDSTPEASEPEPSPAPSRESTPVPPSARARDGGGEGEEAPAASPAAAARPSAEAGAAPEPEAALRITTAALPPAVTGTAYYVPLFAEGGTLPYAWRLSSGALPAGIELDGTHGMLRGTARTAETAQVGLAVVDAAGRRAESVYVLAVTDGGGIAYERPQGKITEPLYITTGALPEAVAKEGYAAKLEATGGTPPYAWSIVAGALPDALSLEPASGLVGGVPSAGGRWVFRAMVSDASSNADVAEYALTVRGVELLILTETLAEGLVGAPYAQTLEASGGTPPYEWRIHPGALPAGLRIDPARGVIGGTPGEPADLLVTARVTDAQGQEAAAELELLVYADALTVVTSNLPDATRDAAYEASLDAEGGTPPYRWSLPRGGLPSGLSLDAASGRIRGTVAATAGDYPFTAAVADAAAEQAERNLAIRVSEPALLSVSGLSAAPSDRKVALAWTNPAHPDFSFTVILRSPASPPSSPEDGVIVYRGAGTEFLDTGLVNDAACHYAALPYTASGVAGVIPDEARAVAVPREVTLAGPADPFADRVVSFNPLSPGGYGSSSLSWALGAPRGAGAAMGSTHVVSLHARANTDNGASAPYGGSITLEFTDNLVVNGPGPDFIVFENAFFAGGDPRRRWIEPAVVSVSKDGALFHTFPFDFVPHYTDTGELNLYNPYCYLDADGSSRGFAGVSPTYSSGGSPDPRTPAAGGDAFDLDALNLDWVRFVRITATGDGWLVDRNGDRVRHVTDLGSCSGAGSSGFDLDAVCAVHY